MILIGENLNVMSKELGEAFKNRDPKPVRAMVEAEVKAGVDVLDLNIGRYDQHGSDGGWTCHL
jgi:5-methyltetrahydrofolate corrinoid/iron sulfur protein methyltransferase